MLDRGEETAILRPANGHAKSTSLAGFGLPTRSTSPGPPSHASIRPATVDVAIVGSGIAGLKSPAASPATAHLFSSGEATRVGEGASGPEPGLDQPWTLAIELTRSASAHSHPSPGSSGTSAQKTTAWSGNRSPNMASPVIYLRGRHDLPRPPRRPGRRRARRPTAQTSSYAGGRLRRGLAGRGRRHAWLADGPGHL